MDAEKDGIMTAVYLKEVLNDYTAEGHRYGCSGIDGTTFAPMPGEKDDKKYHHIIDPETLYPSEKWKSVSIICTDSGLGDALSTALFLLDQEEGQKLLDECDACAVWVDLEGEIYYSPGFKELIKT